MKWAYTWLSTLGFRLSDFGFREVKGQRNRKHQSNSTMTPAPPRLSSCAPSTLFTASSNFPPKLPISKQNLLPKRQNNQQSYRIEFEISRRDAFLLSFLTLAPSLALPDPANAFSIGICTCRFHSLSKTSCNRKT